MSSPTPPSALVHKRVEMQGGWGLGCVLPRPDQQVWSDDWDEVTCGLCRYRMSQVTENAPADLCHNGHPFEPGQSVDALDEPGDPRWCDVCGEARR